MRWRLLVMRIGPRSYDDDAALADIEELHRIWASRERT